MTFWRRWGAKTRIIFILLLLAYFILWATLAFTRAGEIVLTAFGQPAILALITSALALATYLLFRRTADMAYETAQLARETTLGIAQADLHHQEQLAPAVTIRNPAGTRCNNPGPRAWTRPSLQSRLRSCKCRRRASVRC
jgi:hypothetical protein